MDDLKSLVKLVSKQKIKNLDQLIWTNQNTKFTDLYDLIATDSVQTDEEACLALYGVEKSQAYQKLRSRMFERLLNTTFFIDKKGQGLNTEQIKYFKTLKYFSIIQILSQRRAKDVAIPLAEKTIKYSLELELIDISILLSKYLRRHFAFINLDKKKFSYYDNLVEELEDFLIALNKLDQLYDRLSHYAATKSSIKLNVFQNNEKEILAEIIQIQEKFDSRKIQSLAFQIRSYYYLFAQEHEMCIDICNQAAIYFNSKNYKSRFYNYVFNNDKFEALISLGRVEEAKAVLKENLELVSTKTFNWFKIKRMELSLALFEQDYDQAYLICKEVIENPNFDKFKTKNELWKIRIAYIQILLQAGYIDMELVSENPMPNYDWNAVLKTLPLYSKDKRGLNITIIVAQLIFLIINNKSLDILDRIDALNRYCSRYLKNNEELRSNCFLKMIAKLPDADFHPLRVERYVDKYKKRLVQTERVLSQEISSTEIISYEVLWDIIFDYIGKNRK